MRKLLVLLLSVLLLFGLMACGDSGNGNATSGNAIAAFLEEDDAFYDTIAPLGAALLGDDGRIDLLAGDGDELIIAFIYGSDVDTSGVSDMLEEILTYTAGIFEEIAEDLRDELSLASVRVTVRFMDADNNVLAEQSYYS